MPITPRPSPLRRLPLCIVIAALLPLAATRAELQPVASVEGITEYRLDNGLRLLLFPDPSRPTVTVNLTVFVGSRHEGAGEGGMAHLLEHMVFKGTPSHANIPKLLQDRGARFNGTTSSDRTNYFETLPASDDNLEFAIRLEADRMVNSYIKGEDLASEMTVVRNEFERSENSVFGVLMQKMRAAAYEWHNYGKPTIGNRSDIERVPLPKLREFYRKFYQPDNAMLVIAGQFEEKKALAFAQQYFGAIPRPDRTLETTYTEEPAQDGEREVVLRRVGEVGLVGAVYHIPCGAHPDYPAVEVLSNILATEPSGRMYKALVETKMASNVYGWSTANHDPGLLHALVEVADNDKIHAVRETLLDLIESIGEQGVSDEEVERAKQQILKRRELAEADTSRLAVALSNWAAQGDWRLYLIFRDRIEAVTADDVQRVAADYLVSHNRTVGTYIPSQEPQRASIPAVPDISDLVRNYKGRQSVTAGEQFDVSPANIESRTHRTTVESGIKTALLPKQTRGEAVQLSLTLRYGNAQNLKGLEKAASFLPRLMTRGTAKLSHQQIQDELDKNLATLSASGSVGSAAFRVQTKRDHLPSVIRLLGQILREPSLPEQELEVLRRQDLAALDQDKNDPRSLASRRQRRLLWPYPSDDVRYIPTVEEQIERTRSAKLEQVKRLYEQFLGNHEGQLVIVGDFDPEETLPLLGEALASWTAKQPYVRIQQQAFLDVPGTQQTILTPDKANATYYAGLIVPMSDRHADYPALLIGDFIFGGGSLASRLGDRVRQQEGLSYGVGSGFACSSLDDVGQWMIYAISNPDNMPKVVQVIREELDLLLQKGITAEELTRAQQGYLQRQQVQRTNDRSLVSILSSDLRAERTMQHHADLEEKIQSLTVDDVNAALRKHVNSKRLVVVTAGDFESAAAQDAGSR